MEKDRKIKIMAVVSLVIAVIGLTIAFMSMTTVLKVVKPYKSGKNGFDIHFENVMIVEESEDANFITKPIISNKNKTKIKDFKVKLSKPKDRVVFEVDVVNDGTKTGIITEINVPYEKNKNYTIKCKSLNNNRADEELICGKGNLNPDIKAEYYYTDGTLMIGSELKPGSKKTLRGIIYYDEKADELPSGDIEIYGLGVSIIYTN